MRVMGTKNHDVTVLTTNWSVLNGDRRSTATATRTRQRKSLLSITSFLYRKSQCFIDRNGTMWDDGNMVSISRTVVSRPKSTPTKNLSQGLSHLMSDTVRKW